MGSGAYIGDCIGTTIGMISPFPTTHQRVLRANFSDVKVAPGLLQLSPKTLPRTLVQQAEDTSAVLWTEQCSV